MRKPTLLDVGIEAGVSAITVSRALRQPDKVSASMRARVDAAVKKLGYVPNAAASTLASKRSNVIGMIVPSFSNVVFSDVIAGAYDALESTALTMQISNVKYSSLKEEALLPSLLSLKPAGLIIAGVEQTQKSIELLQDFECPIVQVMDIKSDPLDMIVGFSHFDAAAMATQHLIDQGYRRVGFLGARMDPRSQKRLAGYRQALEQSGIFDPNLQATTQTPSSVEVGGHLMADLLSSAPDCDAIFCNNDDIAVGAIFECQRRNISIPNDIAVCGFNDLGTVSQMNPSVTSVFTPRFEIGRTAVEMVIKALGGILSPEEKIVELPVELRSRASTPKK